MNHDLIIRDATIFDGTGLARYRADVAVSGDRIQAIGDLGASTGTREVIATGKALSPGFIDAHTHDDRAVLCGPECMGCKMSQGVTTVVVGNCGISLSPVRMKSRPPPPTDEVIAVAEALRATGGIYVTHMRDEDYEVLNYIEETLRIGRDSGVGVVISHHKCSMPENFGRSTATLAAIDAAARRQAVDFDVYPYPAGSTVLMPDRVRPDVPVRITWSIPHPEAAGKMLADLAQDWQLGLKAAAEKLLPAGGIFYQMEEGDVQRILSHPRAMIGSDGLPHDAFPHPRLWGTFPRVLGHYARDLRLFSLEDAVHKMTGRTAQVFGMTDRGVIRAGAYADLVLFDPATVRDAATYEQPTLPAEGILETWVNGQSAYVAGAGATAAHAGRLVTRLRE